MKKENDLSTELLKQNGIEDSNAAEKSAREQLRAKIDDAQRAARFTKVLAIVLWCLTLGCFLLLPRLLRAGIVHDRATESVFADSVSPYIGLVTWALGLMALIFSVLWYLRWRSATLLEINARLSRLEQHIGRLVQPR